MLTWSDLKKYSMSIFSSSIKKITVLLLISILLLSGCGLQSGSKGNVTIADISGFSATSDDETEKMDQLYLYINEHSEVWEIPEAQVTKMADNIEAFYINLTEAELRDYNARGNKASFEDMLYFLFQLKSREALRAFAEGYAKAEVKNRMVIRAIAERDGIEVSDAELAEAGDTVDVSAYLSGDRDEEVRYELLRRKVLRSILSR